MDTHKIAENNLLFYTVTGSHAYGMNTEHSDVDYRGIFYAPKDIRLSAFKTIEQVEAFGGEKDSTVYELEKYMRLLVDQNPNILELLWVDHKFIKWNSSIFMGLQWVRDKFLSSKAAFTFSGYAMSQLKRMKGHNKWINNPQPKRRPKETDYVTVVWNATGKKEWNKEVPLSGFEVYHLGADIYGMKATEDTTVTWYDVHEAISSKDIVGNQDAIGTNFDILVKFNKQLYREAVDNWQHYWTWKKERNEKRSELEEAYGYDTKHASHLIRLLRMGIEILKDEGVKVLRPDAQELLAIRNGKFSYEEIIKEAEGLDSVLKELYKTTKLRHNVDLDEADRIMNMMYEYGWGLDNNPSLKADHRIGYKYYTETLNQPPKGETNGTETTQAG